MSPPQGKGMKDIRNGAVLQMAEAITLGMPFEVWKTRMGRFRNENTIQAFRAVHQSGGGGLAGLSKFWQGSGPKMVESASKGAVLLYAKESIKDACIGAGIGATPAGFIAGAGGGIAQTTVMGPCTFLVTAVVTNQGDKAKPLSAIIRNAWANNGIRGFYPGGTAIAFRQATNWASRQGFTDGVRSLMKHSLHGGDPDAKLTVGQEVLSGMMGGMLACWNHPFEVARIEMQARAAAGESSKSMVKVLKDVHAEYGMPGLFKGIIPRIGLGVWQTLFMVTGANLVRDFLG
jgi:hypothetical protein